MTSEVPAALQSASVPRPVLAVLAGLTEAGHEAFLVGGCVRDLLLEKTPKDWDVTTQALPEQVQKLFRRVLPTGIDHGTVTVMSDKTPVEVTTYRFEGNYVDGRRPSSVEFRRDLTEDLARRDFTINALAFNPVSQDFRDPFHGREDLAARTIRCVGKALDRFSEDGLRALRAVRFSTVLEFNLEPATEAAIPQTLAIFRKVALERVREELMKLLLAKDAERGLRLLESTGLLAEFLPEAVGGHEAFASVGRAEGDEVVRLAALLPAAKDPRAVLLRLKFPNKTADQVAAVLREPMRAELAQASDAELRRYLVRLNPEHLSFAAGLARANQVPRAEELIARLEAVLASKPPLSTKALALDGKALMAALEVSPSPLVGECSRYLLECVLDDPSLNTPDQLTERARAFKAQRKA